MNRDPYRVVSDKRRPGMADEREALADRRLMLWMRWIGRTVMLVVLVLLVWVAMTFLNLQVLAVLGMFSVVIVGVLCGSMFLITVIGGIAGYGRLKNAHMTAKEIGVWEDGQE